MVDCIFCDIVARRAPAWIVYEDDKTLAFFSKGPIVDYHTLIVPKCHASDVFDVSAQDWRAVMDTAHKIAATYRAQLGIEHLQIITSNGRDAQQDVFHLHVHLVPRSTGDGQDVIWFEDPHIAERFDALLAAVSIQKG